MRRFLLLICVLTLVPAACTGSEPGGPAISSPGTSTSSTLPATTTTSEATTSTTPPPTGTTTLPGGDLVPCESPEGYTISYPADWAANPGDVVPACGQFHPSSFEVTGTEERAAAITVYVDQVPFHEVAGPDADRDVESAITTIDGLQAVRLELETSGDSPYGAGVPVTVYAIDLSAGVDDGPGTMFVDTLGLTGFDYERNRVVLDRMARSIDVAREGVGTDPSVVARYEGGGGGFVLRGEPAGTEACLSVDPDGEAACVPVPGPTGFETTTVTGGGIERLAGVTGAGVFRVEIETSGGDSPAFLPAPIPAGDARGFAFPVSPDDVTLLTAWGIGGDELGSARFEGAGAPAP